MMQVKNIKFVARCYLIYFLVDYHMYSTYSGSQPTVFERVCDAGSFCTDLR
jgi:hypothetical protein